MTSLAKVSWLVGMALLGSCGARDCHPGDLSPATMAQAERQGTELRHLLAVFEKFHGSYPVTLDQLGVGAEITRMPCGTTWTYTPASNGASYLLRLGDYGRNGFLLEWNDRNSTWQWDT